MCRGCRYPTVQGRYRPAARGVGERRSCGSSGFCAECSLCERFCSRSCGSVAMPAETNRGPHTSNAVVPHNKTTITITTAATGSPLPRPVLRDRQ
jgi:hypothetical protein